MYPYHEFWNFEKVARKYGLFLRQEITLLNQPGQQPVRVVVRFLRTVDGKEISELSIRQSPNNYSEEFVALMRPYYLNL